MARLLEGDSKRVDCVAVRCREECSLPDCATGRAASARLLLGRRGAADGRLAINAVFAQGRVAHFERRQTVTERGLQVGRVGRVAAEVEGHSDLPVRVVLQKVNARSRLQTL